MNAGMLWVALGGAIGAMLRYSLSLVLVPSWAPNAEESWRLPWATLLANALGCFAIGLVWGLWQDSQWFAQWGRTFLLVGLLGGFTTFSTFSLEFMRLLEVGRLLEACSYVVLSLLSCLLLVWLGRVLAAQAGHG